jgi:uncharacterized damage-inducible protein DinB
MKTFFKGLFEYDQLVNEKMIASIIYNSAKVDERTLQLISHIVLVQTAWNNRMLQKDWSASTWQLPNLETLQQDNTANNQTSLQILAEKDLAAMLTYRNTKGEEFNNTYGDILYHIINHNNYHRGQVNAGLRESGIEPVVTDYISYKR